MESPLLITMKKVAVALAAGNSLVLKPSELGPVVPGRLVMLLEDAGVPRGVLSFVPGLGRSTGKALIEHRFIAKLDVTGGTETGRAIAAAAGHALIPITAELSGKAPVLVFDDVDIDEAVAGLLFAALIATGQTCVGDVGRAVRVSRRLDIGIVWVNDHHRIDPASPWGGFKDSGIGSENGIEAFRADTQQQSLIIKQSRGDFDWFGTVADLRYS